MADQAAGWPKAAAARLGVAAAALGSARVAGLTWAELGLGRKDLARGACTGAVAAGCAAAVILTGAVLPATRSLFLDERASAAMGRDLAAELARITFIAVPAEELTYRSAAFGLGLRIGSPAACGFALGSNTRRHAAATDSGRNRSRGPDSAPGK